MDKTTDQCSFCVLSRENEKLRKDIAAKDAELAVLKAQNLQKDEADLVAFCKAMATYMKGPPNA